MVAGDVMDTAQGISLGIGMVVGFTVILGIFYRVVLLPALRKDLIDPMRETHQAVTTNSHTSETPTLPDRLSDLSKQVEAVQRGLEDHIMVGREQLGEVRVEVRRLARDLERHEDQHTGVPSQRRPE